MLRFDPDDVDGLADQVAALAAAGAEKAIFILPTPHDPAHVDLVAELAASMA